MTTNYNRYFRFQKYSTRLMLDSRGFRGVKGVEVHLLGCRAMWTYGYISAFRKTFSPLTSGQPPPPPQIPVSPKCWYLPTSWQIVTTRKNIIDNVYSRSFTYRGGGALRRVTVQPAIPTFLTWIVRKWVSSWTRSDLWPNMVQWRREKTSPAALGSQTQRLMDAWSNTMQDERRER